MENVDWLLRNPRLIPGAICFILGVIFVLLPVVLYQIRTKQLILFSFNLFGKLNSRERKLGVTGFILAVLGIIAGAICD